MGSRELAEILISLDEYLDSTTNEIISDHDPIPIMPYIRTLQTLVKESIAREMAELKRIDPSDLTEEQKYVITYHKKEYEENGEQQH